MGSPNVIPFTGEYNQAGVANANSPFAANNNSSVDSGLYLKHDVDCMIEVDSGVNTDGRTSIQFIFQNAEKNRSYVKTFKLGRYEHVECFIGNGQRIVLMCDGQEIPVDSLIPGLLEVSDWILCSYQKIDETKSTLADSVITTLTQPHPDTKSA